MVDIKFTIPNDKVSIVVDSFKTLNPIPMNEEGIALFEDEPWVKEVIKQFIFNTVHRGKLVIAINDAKNTITEDKTIII